MKKLPSILFTLCAVSMAGSAAAAPWNTAPSYFTHDPQSGERVTQYSEIGPFYIYPRGDYVKSGYRHTRSRLQGGGSQDNLHIVEEWGRPVRPYGEWQFPYRPYSVPYPYWGPPPNFYGIPLPFPYSSPNRSPYPGAGRPPRDSYDGDAGPGSYDHRQRAF